MKALTIEDFYKPQWIRNCPTCGKERKYCNKDLLKRATKDNCECKSCSVKGKKHPMYGKHHSEEAKRQIALKGKGNQHAKGKVPWNKGIPRDEVTKQKISKNHKGKKSSEEARRKISETLTGRPCSEAHKQKIRIAHCKRFQEIGIRPCVDQGAPEWFAIMKDMGYNFEQNYYLRDQGYYADGYDPDRHIWFEYDTPHHVYPRKRAKDLIRQQNIIKHFESIGNPLNQFVRVDATKIHRLGIEVVYRGKIDPSNN